MVTCVEADKMIGTPGAIFDPYDDGFESLQRMMRGREVPDFIKTASILDQEDLQRLPDHAFAMVVVGDGCSMRKYACIDPAHVTVNVMYFLEHADDLHESVKEKVAHNLLRACNHFGVVSPTNLTKMASGNRVLIKSDGSNITVSKYAKDAADRLRAASEKTSELSGTPVMPYSARPSLAKLSAIISDPYVTLDTPNPRKAQQYDPAICALDDGTLPLASYGHVKEAMAFFHSFNGDMHPRQRHEICVKIAARADALGIPVDDVIRKYGSRTFETSVFLKSAALTRKQIWAEMRNGEAPHLLEQLLEKQASAEIAPDVFAEALAELDVTTGIDMYWDSTVPDPWFSTYGHQKIAEDEEWRWVQGTEYLTKNQLSNFVNSQRGKEALTDTFNEKMAEGLRDKPTVVFDSLPMDTKRTVARMAQQHESGL